MRHNVAHQSPHITEKAARVVSNASVQLNSLAGRSCNNSRVGHWVGGVMQQQSVLIVDGGLLFRDGLSALLGGTSFVVRDEVATTAALRLNERVPALPDVVLLDASGHNEDIAGSLEVLRKHYPQAHLVVLSATVSTNILGQAFGAGASGYLLKDISSGALIECLNLVVMGEKVFPTTLADLLVHAGTDVRESEPNPSQSGGEPVTRREWQILDCLVDGDPNKRIAQKLAITEATVKVHLRTLLRKLGVRNRTQAAIWKMHHTPPTMHGSLRPERAAKMTTEPPSGPVRAA
jgi:two-component system, NarL family, nitrate/nitrite response regulator NarL